MHTFYISDPTGEYTTWFEMWRPEGEWDQISANGGIIATSEDGEQYIVFEHHCMHKLAEQVFAFTFPYLDPMPDIETVIVKQRNDD